MSTDQRPSPPVYDFPEGYERAGWVDDDSAFRSARAGRRPVPPRRWRTLRRAGVTLLAVVGLFAVVSMVSAATTPGNANFKAKWADWLRAHHAGIVVNPLERWYYSSQAPAPGGRPRGLHAMPRPSTDPLAQPTSTSHLSLPAPVPLVVSPALPAEGRWQPTGPVVNGRPGMYIAQYRADTLYTGQITTAVWIDPTALRVRLVPGAREPGGTWTQPPDLAGAAATRAVAAFNGGFRFQDAKGGFYLDGRMAVPLRAGAASIVIDGNGRIDIGSWGSEVTMGPQVTAVLQNLVPLVDGGHIAPDASYHDTRLWGTTLGASTIVARSGIGVTANGALIYVAGPALTAKTLAEALQRAGAVRAMTLDINPEWVTFNLFNHPDAAHVDATKLYPSMQRPATRYLGPTRESRDFFSVSTG